LKHLYVDLQLPVSVVQPITAVLQKALPLLWYSQLLHTHYQSNAAKFYPLPQYSREICPHAHNITTRVTTLQTKNL